MSTDDLAGWLAALGAHSFVRRPKARHRRSPMSTLPARRS